MAPRISIRRTGEHLIVLSVSNLATEREADFDLAFKVKDQIMRRTIREKDLVLINFKEVGFFLMRSSIRSIMSAVNCEIIDEEYDYSKYGFGYNNSEHYPFAFVISHPVEGSEYEAGEMITAQGKRISYREAIHRKRL